jgi:hypothetical protein
VTVSSFQEWQPTRSARVERTAQEELAGDTADADERERALAELRAFRKAAAERERSLLAAGKAVPLKENRPAGPAGRTATERPHGRKRGRAAGGAEVDKTGRGPRIELEGPRRPPQPRLPVAQGPDGDGWRETAAAVDRLFADDGPRDALRRAIEGRTQERLRAAVPLARTLVDDVLQILDGMERHQADRPQLASPGLTLVIAAEFPWHTLLQERGRTADAGWVTAARSLQLAMQRMVPSDLELAHGALRQDLLQLKRALRAADETRPLSRRRLLGLLTAVLRVAETVAVGVLAAAVSALQKGEDSTAAAFTAAIGLVVTTLCERAIKIVRAARTPPSPGERLQAAHEELEYVTSDLLQLIEERSRDRELLEDTYTIALAFAHHARRLAGTLAWVRAEAYVRDVDRLVELLTARDVHLLRFEIDPDLSGLAAACATVAAYKIPVDHHARPKT